MLVHTSQLVILYHLFQQIFRKYFFFYLKNKYFFFVNLRTYYVGTKYILRTIYIATFDQRMDKYH